MRLASPEYCASYLTGSGSRQLPPVLHFVEVVGAAAVISISAANVEIHAVFFVLEDVLLR